MTEMNLTMGIQCVLLGIKILENPSKLRGFFTFLYILNFGFIAFS